MSIHPAPFEALPWSQGQHPLEKKKVCADGHLVQLRFDPGFEDPDWCTRGHCLFAQEGTLKVILRDSTIEVQPGNAVVLTEGTPHRAANPGDTPITVLAVQYAIIPRERAEDTAS